MTDKPNRVDLLAVCTFARRFDEPDFVAGAWVAPEPQEDVVLQIGYWRPSEDVARWMLALDKHRLIAAFDWTEPEWTQEMRRFTEDPSRLRRADLDTVRKVLTTLIRSVRFCEGSLGEAFERGVPQAAMRRMQTIGTDRLADRTG